MKRFRSEILAAVLLVVWVILLYWPVCRFDFVDYDDPVYITQNDWVQKGFTLESLRLSLREWVSGNWHPLTMWSHLLDVELFGVTPAGHHLHSLLLHAANAALLFLVLRRMTGAFWPSLAVAALWASHPLNMDSVAWIAERKNLLSTFFWLVTIGLYARHVRLPQSNTLLAVLFSFVLSLMAKPMAVTLPFSLLLLDYWPLRRVEGFGRAAWPAWKHLVMEKVPLFILCGIFMLTTLKTQVPSGATQMGNPLSLGARLAYVPIHYVDYLRVFFWPSGLCALYPQPVTPPALLPAVLAALAMLAVSLFVFKTARRRPYGLVGWLWFLGTLVPVLGIVSLGLHSIADRYMYVPMIGLLVLLIWTVKDAKLGRGRIVAGGLTAAAVVILGLVTRHQLPHWKNSEALFRRALAVTSRNYVMHYNLGRQLALRQQLD
ncbi:MAG: glycosyltransferase family 39 protein, partial [Verrucomicrobia bacterium]|nr:glycosyltransferase family 39 protein [Verrucomicrobiota bacterium]